MKTFYEWITEFTDDRTPRGQLAEVLFEAADSGRTSIKEIDSFGDMVDLADPATDRYCPEFDPRYGGSLSCAISENLWHEYCEATGHSV